MKASLNDLGKKLLKDQTDRTTIQLFRYIFVGGAAFIVDFGLSVYTHRFFGVYYLISNAIAFILGFCNYNFKCKLVF